MKLTRRSLAGVALLVLGGLFLLAGVVADAWLETSGGKALLQRELSKSLGLPVQLEGVYHIKFIPRLQIAGTELRVGITPGEAVLASSEKYAAAVELLPFIRGKIRIASIELSGGFVDLNRRTAGSAAEESPPSGTSETLPQIASLEISDFFVRTGRDESGILIEHLRLSGFQPDRATGLTMTATLMQAGIRNAELNLQGELTVRMGAGPGVSGGELSAAMRIQNLEIGWPGVRFTGLHGLWEWNQAAAQLTGEMAWSDEAHSVDLSLTLVVGEPVSGQLTGHYGSSGSPEPLELGTGFSFSPDQIELNRVYLDQAGQMIRGAGCVLLTDPASVHLTLSSNELDLDRLKEVLPGGVGGDTDMAVDLAVVLRVSKARLGGAVASDVVVEIGSEPGCPAPAGPDL